MAISQQSAAPLGKVSNSVIMTKRQEGSELMDDMDLETVSQVSGSSRWSKLSTTSSMAAKARAKAEAARARLAFAKKEAEMLKQQAILQANLHELKMEKAAAAANAEAEVLESAAQEEHEQMNAPYQTKSRAVPHPSSEHPGENCPVLNPAPHPSLPSHVIIETVNALNTVSLSEANPPLCPHTPAFQPAMDSGGRTRCSAKQGDATQSEISDYAFVELEPQFSYGGETTWNSTHAPDTTSPLRKPPLHLNTKPSVHHQPLQTNPASSTFNNYTASSTTPNNDITKN